jgi:hypothetical protein
MHRRSSRFSHQPAGAGRGKSALSGGLDDIGVEALRLARAANYFANGVDACDSGKGRHAGDKLRSSNALRFTTRRRIPGVTGG